MSNKHSMSDKSQNAEERGQDKPQTGEQPSLCPIPDRKKLLQITASLIEETHTRISGDRFRPREGDRERLAYIRALRELISLHEDLLKASGAPAYSGIPDEPTEEDLEIEQARREEKRNLQKVIVNLAAHRRKL